MTSASTAADRLLALAARVPDAPAVVEGMRVYSYGELAERAAAFATVFADGPRRRVLIASEKGFQAYAAMFGSLLAGATYAPVNVASTSARLETICASFEPDTIVADANLVGTLAPFAAARAIAPDAPLPDGTIEARASEAIAHSDIAYVIFTSGSTGAPKGVAIPRPALDHYVDWIGPAMGLAPGDRMSQHPNIGFDLSVLDIYGALCHGAALYPFVDRGARLLPARKVREDRLTVWNSVPSVLSIMETARELDAAHLESVRLFTFCGEVLRRDHVAKLFAARPDAIVLNTYGPTEATVAMTCRRFTIDDWERACTSSAPFGEAIGEMRLDLVGGDHSDEGEMVISGPQLAAGYWNDPALTAEKFRDHTRDDGRVVKAFFTGDYAERREGETYFLGRRDDMVKVRGHRMHVGAVSQALEKVGWPVSFAFEQGGQLFAIVEAVAGKAFDQGKVAADLSGLLESYSVPSEIRCVDTLPKNQNDKIDGPRVRAMFERATLSRG